MFTHAKSYTYDAKVTYLLHFTTFCTFSKGYMVTAVTM